MLIHLEEKLPKFENIKPNYLYNFSINPYGIQKSETLGVVDTGEKCYELEVNVTVNYVYKQLITHFDYVTSSSYQVSYLINIFIG